MDAEVVERYDDPNWWCPLPADAWCCTTVTEDLVRQYTAFEIPAALHANFGAWQRAGITPRAALDWLDLTAHVPLLSPGDLVSLVRAYLDPTLVRRAHDAGITAPWSLVEFRTRGGAVTAAEAWLAAHRDEDNADRIGEYLVDMFTRMRRTGAPAQFCNDLLDTARDWHQTDLTATARDWHESGLPASRAVLLAEAGVTPAEVERDPTLAQASPEALATLSALRGTGTRPRGAPV